MVKVYKYYSFWFSFQPVTWEHSAKNYCLKIIDTSIADYIGRNRADLKQRKQMHYLIIHNIQNFLLYVDNPRSVYYEISQYAEMPC